MAEQTIEFAGREFRVADKVGLMPLMRFAHLARQGIDSDDMEGLAAIYDLVRSAIADEDWAAFEQAAMDSRADADELIAVSKRAIEAISARPTSESSDSSDGPLNESGSSADGSSLAVIHRMEEAGRPSIALMVSQAQGSRRSA